MFVYDFLTDNPWLIILILLLVFGAIVGAVILIRRYSPHFKSNEKPKTDEEIAKEEVERLTVPMDEENKNLEEAKKEAREIVKEKPSEKEAADYESHCATIEADEDFQRQMEEYAKSHPEEEAISSSDLSLHEDDKK